MMHPLGLLMLAAAAAGSLARPPNTNETPERAPVRAQQDPLREPYRAPTVSESDDDGILPQYILPNYLKMREERPAKSKYDWLTKEIDRLTLMEEAEQIMAEGYADIEKGDDLMSMILDLPPDPFLITEDSAYRGPQTPRPAEILDEIYEPSDILEEIYHPPRDIAMVVDPDDDTNSFGYLAFEKGFYSLEETSTEPSMLTKPLLEEPFPSPQTQPTVPLKQRNTRQNPNFNPRTKTLVAQDLDILRGSVNGNEMSTPHHNINFEEDYRAEAVESVFGVAVIAAVCASFGFAIIIFAIGWYTLSKKAKAAADVDYPAYGVTGPSKDTTGDRKLAHSAQMYHYQHQKQQILALERSSMEGRKSSLSDPESEEENEEGDYTVYECPGFATTGDMEVKNPMFAEDPSLATPGKIEVGKPQIKE